MSTESEVRSGKSKDESTDKRTDNQSSRRLTFQDLVELCPIIQDADEASKELKTLREGPLEDGLSQVSVGHLLQLQSRVDSGEAAFDRLDTLQRALFRFEIYRLLRTSSLKSDQQVADQIYQKGLDGLRKGSLKFNPDMSPAKSTGYIMQWAISYARNELLKLEAPMGMGYTRYSKYKKIYAIRSALSGLLERDPSDQEVYEYIQSGKADRKSVGGRKSIKMRRSKANLAITIEDIREQKRIYEMNKNLPRDPEVIDATVEVDSGPTRTRVHISDTIFGDFVESYPGVFTESAITVLADELGFVPYTFDDSVMTYSQVKVNKIFKQWQNLFLDPEREFAEYVRESESSGNKLIQMFSKELKSKSIHLPDSEFKELYASFKKN